MSEYSSAKGGLHEKYFQKTQFVRAHVTGPVSLRLESRLTVLEIQVYSDYLSVRMFVTHLLKYRRRQLVRVLKGCYCRA